MKKCGQKRVVISVPIFGKLLLLIVSRLSLQHSGTAPQVTVHLHHFLFDTNQCRGFRMFLKLELSAFRLAGLAGLGLLSLFSFQCICFEITKLRTFGVLLKTTVGQSVYFIRTTLVHAAWLAWLGWVCFYYVICIKLVGSIIWRAFVCF